MVEQGQQSPVVSLPFRLYWLLSDPTVWMIIIRHTLSPPLPCCVPPVSQTSPQKPQTCAEKSQLWKSPQTHITNSTRQNKRITHSMNFPFLRKLFQTHSDTTAFHLHHFPPVLTECVISSSEESPSADGHAFPQWKCRQPFRFPASGALHGNISVGLRRVLAQSMRWLWATRVTFTWPTYPAAEWTRTALRGQEIEMLSGAESNTEPRGRLWLCSHSQAAIYKYARRNRHNGPGTEHGFHVYV